MMAPNSNAIMPTNNSLFRPWDAEALAREEAKLKNTLTTVEMPKAKEQHLMNEEKLDQIMSMQKCHQKLKTMASAFGMSYPASGPFPRSVLPPLVQMGPARGAPPPPPPPEMLRPLAFPLPPSTTVVGGRLPPNLSFPPASPFAPYFPFPGPNLLPLGPNPMQQQQQQLYNNFLQMQQAAAATKSMQSALSNLPRCPPSSVVRASVPATVSTTTSTPTSTSSSSQHLNHGHGKKLRPKRFQCPHCQVCFSNNGQLKGHVRIHTGKLVSLS